MSRSDRQTERSVIAFPSPEPLPGTYALILSSSLDQILSIGRLGQLHVRPGFYVYVGSAFGPGGVKARIAHHARLSRRPHWHIDYLRRVAQLNEIWWTHDPIRREHQWAALFGHMRGSSIPLSRFGSSDCTCASHLYFLPKRPVFSAFQRQWQRHARKVSTMVLKAPLRVLWRHSYVPKATSFCHVLGKPR